MSRISTAQIYSGAETNIREAREKERRSLDVASTQKTLIRPSQDPVGWVTSRNLKDQIAATSTASKTTSLTRDFLSATENVFANVQESLGRTHELLLSASNDPLSNNAGAMAAVLLDLKQIFGGVMANLNSQFNGRTLFGGYQTRALAFDGEGNFQADQGSIQVNIDKGLRVAANIPSGKAVLGEGSGDGIQLPALYQKIIRAVEELDVLSIRETLPAITQAIDQLSIGRAEIGAIQSQIDRTLIKSGEENILAQERVAEVEEAIASVAFTNLVRDQNILKAALSTTEKMLHENPLELLLK